MEQLKINFATASPINMEKLTGQNRRLYDHLASGKSIHCMSEDRVRLQIGYLNSRISDLKKMGFNIVSQYIQVADASGNETTVKLYTLAK